MKLSDRLAQIPAFDPDHEDDPGAVAGAVKNAFDWLVGSGVTYRKPFAVVSAGTSGGLHARRILAQTLVGAPC